MKWLAPSEKAQMWLVAPLAIPIAVVFIPIILCYVVSDKVARWLNPSRDWHEWFAWRPVPLGHWSDHVGARGTWAWLEYVERRSMPYDWPTEYRLISGRG